MILKLLFTRGGSSRANTSCFSFRTFYFVRPHRATFRTGTVFAQEIPGVNPQLMAVVPAKLDCVLAYGFRADWLCRRFEHRQRSRHRLWRLTNFPAAFVALLVTQSAGTCIAQPGKRIAAGMAVFPIYFHAGAGSQVDPD